MSKESEHHVNPTIRANALQMRRERPPAEDRLWKQLRDKQTGFKFRYQHPIQRYIVDFCCMAARLIVEVDGDSHAIQEQYDAARTAWLEQRGWQVLRFTNTEVYESLEGVVETIIEACKARTSSED